MELRKNQLKEFLFPLGGIGGGSISIAGNGVLRDFEIFNKPNKGSYNGLTFFAVRAEDEKGNSKSRVLCGDTLKDFVGRYTGASFDGYGFGITRAEVNGFPHFTNYSVDCKFPFCTYKFFDEDFPLEVILTAWSPFIPLDQDNSSLPSAFFNVSIVNKSKEKYKTTLAFSLGCPYDKANNFGTVEDNGAYVSIKKDCPTTDKHYGDISVYCSDNSAEIITSWYRGEWNDGAVIFWQEFQDGAVKDRKYATAGKDNATLICKGNLGCGEKRTTDFVISWNTPYFYNYWDKLPKEIEENNLWKNYYATKFTSSLQTARYCIENIGYLREETEKFSNEIHACTFPNYVLDAIISSLSVLKSGAIHRLEDGSFYGFEGAHEREGSCEGTCQHVYNYAYATCFLFPELEKSIRDLEFKYQTNEHGAMQFRLKLPLGSNDFAVIPCVDGQMGAVIKAYREWKISGDDLWLKNNWEKIKSVLEYAWNENNSCKWDELKSGVVRGRMHHTLDMELFGANGWLQSFYLCALKAAAEMATYLKDEEKVKEYGELFDRGSKWMDENLFNGEYYYQKIDLKDKSVLERFGVEKTYWNEESKEIKYQIGEGCIIDQLLGQWHANILGLGNLVKKSNVKKALRSVYKNNFKKSQREFSNVWRVFSAKDERGTVICDYPKGVYKPVIPVPYTDETMTGMEYAFAGLLISEGLINKGFAVVKAVRDRYTGERRNPFNEIECGSNYARSMAAYALMPILSGFTFDMPKRYISFNPKINKDDFYCVWGVKDCWGVFQNKNNRSNITVKKGSITLEKIGVPYAKSVEKLTIDGKAAEFKYERGCLTFEKTAVNSSVEIVYYK